MISAQEAVMLTKNRKELDKIAGAEGEAFIRSYIAPALDAAARAGQSSIVIRDVRQNISQPIQNALKALGYTTQMHVDDLHISW